MSNILKKITQSTLSILSVVALLLSPMTVAFAEEAEYNASFIQKLEDVRVDYSDFVNSSVMQPLPSSIKADQEISVIITVGETTVMDAYERSNKTMSLAQFAQSSDEAAAINADIAAKRADILARLDEKGVSYEMGKEYNTLLRGFELVIKGGDFRTVCGSLGKDCGIVISEEYKVAETQLVENTVNVYDTGIFDSSQSGYDGSGTVVAVLDTGLDSKHTAFSVDNFTSDTLGLTYEDVAKVLKDTKASEQTDGLTVDDVYINNKVPFGYDYADSDPDPFSTHNNHGTHVSGVIVGKDDTLTGVAPNAQLVSMKIFSDVMDTARAAWILAALEDCVVLDVDVINMSLGTACGFASESEEELTAGVYEKIRKAGISMIVAASNSYNSAYSSEKNGNLPLTSNPDSGTVGSPSTYEGTMSVASINGVETPYIKFNGKILYFIESNTGSAEENDFCETLLGDQDKIEIEYVVVPGVGRSADYTGLDVKGKIALVRRGSNTFEEKAMIAEAQGAAGIIIYNNVSGDIKMNVGDAKLAVCSIAQDDGEMLAAAGGGLLTISKDQSSGPFISDFSSWGPTPSLGIKPEITAHGGEILSSVTGGDYDRLSGTSMACPNLAGVVLLLRQYVKETFADIADDSVAVNNMVNRLMMSTADIIYNKNGLPYAIRKQGAGLANLLNSLGTKAYIATFTKDGKEMDKTKLELGDDKEKTGVYEMTFSVVNFGDKSLSYELGSIVLTEGVSETKTSHGETTVTEEAYELTGATMEIGAVEGGALTGKRLTVAAGETAKVTVKVVLGEEDKKYLNKSFANGMYVEGFITLTAKGGTDIDMNVPYLAFYGDWGRAPMLDLDYFATNADELDDAIDPEDKTMADAYATRPIGGVQDDYVSYLGTYYFLQDPENLAISADRKYISLSNQIGTIHSLRYIWTGLLRNAAKVDVTITDDTTGEVIFECTDDQVRKSYSDGGASIYPANVEVEFDTMDYNLKNNTKYTVKMVTHLDYDDGALETNESNIFEFPLTIDFEAPAITDVDYYYEYDKTLKKNRLYAKIGVYDNHHAMAAQMGYVTSEENEEGVSEAVMKNFDQFLTPIYSEENSTTTITYELTDYVYALKETPLTKNTFVVSCYDYALNYATYEIGLPNDFKDFFLDGIEEGVTLSPNEVFTLEPLVYPATEWGELLEFSSSRTSVARIVNNKIVAVAPGTSIIKITDPNTKKSTTFTLTVLDKEDEGYRKYDKPVADVFRLDGYTTKKAYYMVANEDKKLGDTGDTRFFEGKYSLEMYPSESVGLNYTLASFYPRDTEVAFESSNEDIVTISADGTITAVAEGFASVTIKVLQDDRSTYYSESVSVEVKNPYVTLGASLSHYYGLGGSVIIPDDLHLTEIGSFAFANFEYVLKTEEELEFDDAETSKQWYIGENTITKVTIPEGVKIIQSYAFANLTGLEEIVLPSTLQSIEYGAFYGCSSLEKITFSGENNLKIVNQRAFENCDLRNTLDLSAACIISDYAFAGNTKLKKVETGDALMSIGQYAFAGCKKITKVNITAKKVKYGAYAFTDCESLKEFTVNSAVLPEGMFYECKKLTTVTIGPDVKDIGPFAFRSTAVDTYIVEKGNKTYKVQTASYVLSADGKQLVAVSPTLRDEVSAADFGGGTITSVGKGAFSHNTRITAVNLPDVTAVGEYGFGSAEGITSVTLGTLTDIGSYAFFETAISVMPNLPKDAVIGKYAFSHSGITSLTIPAGSTVSEGAFSECMKLKDVTIGDKVTLEKFAFNVSKDTAFKVNNYDEDGERYFYYEFATALETVTIGTDAVIGENAFAFHASLKKVTLGAGAEIGKMAFYNNTSLEEIDLSGAKSIGDYAFSGDVYYICLDEAMGVAAVNKEGTYMYTYHAPALKTVDLTAVEELGEHAFSYCRDLTQVTLGEKITEIKPYAFAGCIALNGIDLSKVTAVGEYAFIESALVTVNLSAAESIGEYAFVNNESMKNLTLNKEGVTIDEGAFSYCLPLKSVKNLSAATEIGDYAFAHTAITKADLSGAKSIGDHAFIKAEYTPFTVVLGDKLETLGDNPFAMCVLKPFCQVEKLDFNGKDYSTKNYNYEISKTVSVIDGSLYCKIDTGWELITFAGPETAQVTVADDTVRISSMAFAGSDVVRVVLPYTVTALGHKTFFDCDKLEMVSFNSYYPPILEEEFDQSYYDSFAHIPGSGDFGTYTDYEGNEVKIEPMGLLPFFMWNATGGMYSNVYYGATFKDYIGYVDNKMTMVVPVNGVNYDSFILAQYFDRSVVGAAAPDATTVAAINAIKNLPERVAYKDKAQVEAARAAYTKIATLLQQSLVSNYADLVSAEQRITALTPGQDEPVTEEPIVEKKPFPWLLVLIIAGALVLLVAAILLFKKFRLGEKTPFRQIGGFCKKVFTPVGKALAKVFAPVAKFLAPVGVFLSKVFAPVGAFLKKIFAPVGRALAKVFAPVGKALATAAKWLGALLKKAGCAVGRGVKVAALWLWNGIKKVGKWIAAPVVAATAKAKANAAARKEKKAAKAAEKTAAKAEKPKKVKKERKPVNPKVQATVKTVFTVLAVIALVVGIVALVVSLLGAKQETPYDVNDAQNFTVSVQYDANGGTFTTNTSIFTDSYSLDEVPTQGGEAKIPLLAPNDANRGKDAFSPVKNGYFLAGWYVTRTDNGNGEYTYSDPWDFEKDRLTVQADGTYSSAQPVLTLYAAWVPEFTVEFCSRTDGKTVSTYTFNPLNDGYELKLPAWDTETGAMEMYKFPERDGYTFEAAYADAAGKQPLTGTITHPGKVDPATGTAVDSTYKVYVDWTEGTWYRISTVEQFLKNASVNGNYIIEADLDFTDKTWPTSLMHGNFAGSIRGNGHTFRNIELTQTNNSKVNGGLFGQLTEKAVLSDVTFENVTFTVKRGARMAGTAYGILSGTLSDEATLTGVTLKDSVLQIDSDCYFGTDDYSVGLVCGVGNHTAVTAENLTCTATGDAPETVEITIDGNAITLKFKE